MKQILLSFLLFATLARAQKLDATEGLWQGYDPEWGHVSRQLAALAEAIPEAKYTWRPAPGVRSTSEVLMHIAISNFWLLSVTGRPSPSDMKSPNLEASVTSKAEVISWLKRSQEAVEQAHAGISPKALQLKVNIGGKNTNVDGIYLRILVHANEHMGQLIAYSRFNGIAPPWSEEKQK